MFDSVYGRYSGTDIISHFFYFISFYSTNTRTKVFDFMIVCNELLISSSSSSHSRTLHTFLFNFYSYLPQFHLPNNKCFYKRTSSVYYETFALNMKERSLCRSKIISYFFLHYCVIIWTLNLFHMLNVECIRLSNWILFSLSIWIFIFVSQYFSFIIFIIIF